MRWRGPIGGHQHGAECSVKWPLIARLRGWCCQDETGLLNGSFGNRYTYDGPDLWGNAIAYGRALYTSQHHVSEAFKVKGREFIIDRDYTLAVAWKLYDGDRMTDIVFGPLTFTPDA